MVLGELLDHLHVGVLKMILVGTERRARIEGGCPTSVEEEKKRQKREKRARVFLHYLCSKYQWTDNYPHRVSPACHDETIPHGKATGGWRKKTNLRMAVSYATFHERAGK